MISRLFDGSLFKLYGVNPEERDSRVQCLKLFSLTRKSYIKV